MEVDLHHPGEAEEAGDSRTHPIRHEADVHGAERAAAAADSWARADDIAAAVVGNAEAVADSAAAVAGDGNRAGDAGTAGSCSSS